VIYPLSSLQTVFNCQVFTITIVTLYMYQVAYLIKKTDFYRVFLKTKYRQI